MIVTFQGNAEDLVISAPAIRNLDSGDKFNQMPNITVKTKSGNAISAKVDVLKQEGLFPSGNVLNDLAEYNASGAAASVSKFTATTSANSMVAAPAGNAKKRIKEKWLFRAKTLQSNSFNIGSNKRIKKLKHVS